MSPRKENAETMALSDLQSRLSRTQLQWGGLTEKHKTADNKVLRSPPAASRRSRTKQLLGRKKEV